MAQLIDIEHRSFEETLQRCADLGGADLLFLSPPYPTEVPGAKGREGAPTRRYGGDTPEHFLWEDYQRLGDCCYRALRPGGFCILIVDGPVRTIDKRIGSERSTIAFEVAIDWKRTERHDGLRFRYVEHESYVRLGPAGSFGPRRRSEWEPMHVFQRPGGGAFFDVWSVTNMAKTGGSRRSNVGSKSWECKTRKRGRLGETHHVREHKKTLTTAVYAAETGSAFNLFSIDSDHPAPFTSRVATVQVLSYSPPGGLVCDPFNGSGTTGIAAAKHGRSFVGGDLGVRERDGRRWADIGRERALEAAGLPPDPRPDDPAPTRPVVQQLGLLDVLG